MLNIATLGEEPPRIIAAERNLPSGDRLIPSIAPGAAKGDPGMGVRTPLAAMVNAEIEFEKSLAQNRNLLFGMTANEISPGLPPVGKGDPGAGVSSPEAALIENTLTLALPVLAAYRNLPTVERVTRLAANKPNPVPVPPVGKGEPAIGANIPFEETEKPETVFPDPTSSFV
jgi:hypothetical protein